MTIWWSLIGNNQVLNAIMDDLKLLNDRVARVETKVDDLGKQVNGIDLRLARVETRLDLPKLVIGD
jgi:archaellum component FlaC